MDCVDDIPNMWFLEKVRLGIKKLFISIVD